FYLSNWAKIPHLFVYHFSDFKFWNIVWLMTAFAVFYNLFYKKERGVSQGLLLIIVLQILLYACGYIILLATVSETMLLTDMQRFLLAPAIMSIFYSCIVLSKN
ncbi:MAG: hypothetical protein AAB276_04490, partial [Pseudomonadota bacterium]